MKKTLIALAVAASAVVSGSALAEGWEQNGSGGNVELGGTLTPADVVTPWEIKVGDAVTGLDALIQRGQRTVELKVGSAIPVLGIRNADPDGFKGQTGINPQIDYYGAVDLTGFSKGVTTLTLPVKNDSGDAIGTMTVPFSAAGMSSWIDYSDKQLQLRKKVLYASSAGEAYYGGLGSTSSAVSSNDGVVISLIGSLFPDGLDNWVDGGVVWDTGYELFTDTNAIFHGIYGAGIESGNTITITLDEPASGDVDIKWNASLPVTIIYA